MNWDAYGHTITIPTDEAIGEYLNTNPITSAQLADASIVSSKLVSNIVQTHHIGMGTVGLDQLNSELREYLGLPSNLLRKPCNGCSTVKIMGPSDTLCRTCKDKNASNE